MREKTHANTKNVGKYSLYIPLFQINKNKNVIVQSCSNCTHNQPEPCPAENKTLRTGNSK